MKKIFILPLLAMVAGVSHAQEPTICTGTGGSTACEFNTGCYEMSLEYSGGLTSSGVQCKGSLSTDPLDAGKPNCTSCNDVINNCETNGGLYSGVSGWAQNNNYGAGWKCLDHGGTFRGGKLDPSKTVLGCCRWETETNCYEIWSGTDPKDGEDGTVKVTACSGGSNQFWSGSGACPTSCPSRAPDYDGKNPTNGYCCWEDNDYNADTGGGYCGPINTTTTTLADCIADGGTQISSCNTCKTKNGGDPNYNGNGGSPISKLPKISTALVVSSFGRNLHIYSAKDATVSMFNMSGAKVYSGKVSAGNSVFSLEKMTPGVYYAVVQAGSSSQRIQVLIK
jgi:hypothetical protein